MNAQAAPNPTPDAMLNDLAALNMRMARVVVRCGEIEQAAIEIVAADLPKAGAAPGSAGEARAAGATLDGLAEWMERAVPRIDRLARALERVSRSVRRSIALAKRLEAGWPRVRSADDRAAMVRRQVKRGVSEVIRRVADSDDTAERLFDDLYERLDDPALEQALLDWPVQEIVRQICRELGLAAGERRQATPSAGAGDTGWLPPARHGPPPA